MAFLKTAQARVVHPNVNKTEWSNIRTAGKAAQQEGNLHESLIDRASEFFSKPFNPNEYLLSHATIVASVDTYEPTGMKLGSVLEDGFRVNRRFADYRIKPECSDLINNNKDSWERKVLLASYKTFIGGHSFCEHVQIEDLSKGRIIDAVARDIGNSVYVDILIANDRKHKDLIRAIENGKMSTLSMGCFLPGTQVSLADGTRVSIEDVQPGDMVLTHKGQSREVLNKQVRGGNWDVRHIQAVGIPGTLTATGNHPFFVYRLPEFCACGCGEKLPVTYPKKSKSLPRRLRTRFRMGHDKRIFNPKNSYSTEEHQIRKARMNEIKSSHLEQVRADELRVGDFLCFPRPIISQDTNTTVERARLLGYFVAEGSFLKYKGVRVATEFNFSLSEKDTLVAETVQLLRKEFPTLCDPWIQDRLDRNTCTVHISGQEIASWFFEHGGEYCQAKRLSAEVMSWPVELHRELIGAWVGGDGHLSKIGKVTLGSTTSYVLATQMHMLMSHCGMWARFECKLGKRSVDLVDVVANSFARDPESGRLPSFTLVLGQTQAQGLRGHTDKVVKNPKFLKQDARVLEHTLIFPITSVEADVYDGFVHNMEVEEDHSYIVEGIAVHNCTVDFTVCTKCGHVAADETEMCMHVKFSKGNTFYDEQGRRHQVAEICGHVTTAPTGGVHFIEASWVSTPAFTGAVLRNVIEPTFEVSKQAAKILASPPPQWAEDANIKAASRYGEILIPKTFGPTSQKLPEGWDNIPGDRSNDMALVLASLPPSRHAEETFLAGWLDEGGPPADPGGDPGADPNAPPMDPNAPPMDPNAPPGGDPSAPAATPPQPKKPFEDLEEDVRKHVLDRVKERLTDDLEDKEDPEGASKNETLNKLASVQKYAAGLAAIVKTSSSDADLINRVAIYNQQSGVDISVSLYRAALKIGSQGQYKTAQAFWAACEKALGDKPGAREARVLFRLSRLISALKG